jgi:hypothetical protein
VCSSHDVILTCPCAGVIVQSGGGIPQGIRGIAWQLLANTHKSSHKEEYALALPRGRPE